MSDVLSTGQLDDGPDNVLASHRRLRLANSEYEELGRSATNSLDKFVPIELSAAAECLWTESRSRRNSCCGSFLIIHPMGLDGPTSIWG